MHKAHDWRLQSIIRKYGFWTALRYCRNLGISFEETYFMMFGKLPTR